MTNQHPTPMSPRPWTAGPWDTRRSCDGSGDIGITANGVHNVIAECFTAMRHSGERATSECAANARLIAAAPALFEALTWARTCFRDESDLSKAIDAALALALNGSK